MLRHLLYSMRTIAAKPVDFGRKSRRRYRGHFEQLENRAMLSATTGPASQTAETVATHISPSDFVVLSVTNQIVTPPEHDATLVYDPGAMSRHDVSSFGGGQPPAQPHFDPESPQDNWGGDPRFLAPIVRTDLTILAGPMEAQQVERLVESSGHNASLQKLMNFGAVDIWRITVTTAQPLAQKSITPGAATSGQKDGLGSDAKAYEESLNKIAVDTHENYSGVDQGSRHFLTEFYSYDSQFVLSAMGQNGSSPDIAQAQAMQFFSCIPPGQRRFRQIRAPSIR